MRPRLAVTLGDPRGIGPEVAAAVLRDVGLTDLCELVTVGPTGCGVAVDHAVGEWDGTSRARAGRLSGAAVEKAVQLAKSGDVAGIVTAPIDKLALREGGYPYPGHTEMLAALTGSTVAMMLASERLRVVLVTTHVSLRQVPDLVTRERILSAAGLTRHALTEWFGIAGPRIALCALNPHAGDGGVSGTEDAEVLAPAAAAAGVAGPYPADTVFVRALRGEFDAVLAPYHDVGMTAVKVASFGEGVNITLGLPFPRCSPDHGTALDIAGKGVASPRSMAAAVRMCAGLAARTRS